MDDEKIRGRHYKETKQRKTKDFQTHKGMVMSANKLLQKRS